VGTCPSMNGAIWASICEPLYHLFVAFEMRDTVTLTGRRKYAKITVNSEKAMNRRSKRTGVGREGGHRLKTLRNESR